MLELRDVVHDRGGTRALDGVTLSIPAGAFVVLAGANGSGKTTLVRHLNGLLTPDDGEVLVDGEPVSDDLVRARTRVGMVFQHARDMFVASTVGEDAAFGPRNLGLPNDEVEARVADALDAVNLDAEADSRLDELSGGEQRRAAIAGALAMNPEYLVLDEPFTGLDLAARESVLSHLRALNAAGTAVVVVTHDLRDLDGLADRVVVLRDGTVALDGAPDEVRGDLRELGVREP
ncbi:energy-coupling factor ABC transporter ATP-binding protein [Halocalculus aciditolerans]|uniref:ABC transporter ATP-binding protein n=1 Tax=Halocalculus aciditolerans TaxID=1383812 RepID=A0A830FEN0_9EURY|nr:ABC transporter ATP-binding protein [Halocalculus aciditolerans]GGL47589.1 ABC transporter ATP-binding protein [Halocalculus aciditolerans]